MQKKKTKSRKIKRKIMAYLLIAALLLTAQPATGIKAFQTMEKEAATGITQNQSGESKVSQNPELTEPDELGETTTEFTEAYGFGEEDTDPTGTGDLGEEPTDSIGTDDLGEETTDPTGIDNSGEETTDPTGTEDSSEETTETIGTNEAEALIEAEGWVLPHGTAKYRCKQEGNIIYCYIQEGYNYKGSPSFHYIMGIKTNPSSGVATNPLPCENLSQLRVAGQSSSDGEYHAGEIIAIGINLTGAKNHDTITIADSLEYNGEMVPVTGLRLQQFLYSYPGSDHMEEEFNYLTDAVGIHIGRYVRSILMGDAAAVAEGYSVDEKNPWYQSQDGILYTIEGEDCYPFAIPDRYQETTVRLAEGCNTIREEYLENQYKYEALHPMEYSMGTLAGDLFSGQYIHHRTFEWREGVTLEEYLTRQNSVYIPMVIKDETYTHSNVLVLYGDGESRQMYEEIEGNHETFISKAFSAKDYRPATISVDRISYTELTAYSMLEQYDFIFIENDTYDYFSEVQYSILESASYVNKYITYAVELEDLEYPDKEQFLDYSTVSQISLPDSLETDSASWLIKNQGRIFPNLQSADGTGTKYKKDAQDVLYAEDDESLCCIGVTTNNKNTEYHLKAEKELHILPDAFGNIGRADIYLHAPVLYLWADCFHDYGLGTDSEQTMQEIYAEYDPAVYEAYRYIGDDVEFPTVGTEEETYRYVAEYVLREKPDSQLSATVNAVQSVPLSGTPLSKQPNYYLNKNNTGAIYLYDIYGKKVSSNTLSETIFSPADEKNADNLLKQLLKVENSKEKVFITTTDEDTKIDLNKSKKLGYEILRSGLSSGELTRALTVINCKYFQYLYLTQSYKRNGKYEYINTEPGLEVFHEKDSNGNWKQCNIDFGLKVSDWEIKDEKKVFTGWVYGIDYKKFKEYYDICNASDEAISDIIDKYEMKNVTTAETLITQINKYVRQDMAYDNYMEINDISWALKDTSTKRNPSHNNVKKHGMCASYSRLAFAIGAKFGYEIIPCKTWKNRREKAVGKGPVHSVSKVVTNGQIRYCDFCWSSSAEDKNTYMYMDNAEMEKYESHYGPEADEMGTVIKLNGKEIKGDELNVFTVTFDGNGGTVRKTSQTTNHEAKLVSLPLAVRRDYLFEGWYTKKALGKKITLKTVYEEDTRVYAHWKKAAPAKVKVKSGKQKNTSLVITYQRIKKVEGYQLQYSTTVSFTARSTNVINNKNWNSTSITIPGLKENYMYYVRVRAFRKDSMGRAVYGPWSAVKKYKIKSSVK